MHPWLTSCYLYSQGTLKLVSTLTLPLEFSDHRNAITLNICWPSQCLHWAICLFIYIAYYLTGYFINYIFGDHIYILDVNLLSDAHNYYDFVFPTSMIINIGILIDNVLGIFQTILNSINILTTLTMEIFKKGLFPFLEGPLKFL